MCRRGALVHRGEGGGRRYPSKPSSVPKQNVIEEATMRTVITQKKTEAAVDVPGSFRKTEARRRYLFSASVAI